MGVHLHARTIDSLMEAGEVRGYTLQHARANFGFFFIVLLYAVNVAENEKWVVW